MKNGLLIALLVLLVVIIGVELVFLVTQQPQTLEQPAQVPVMTQSPQITMPPVPTQAPVTAPPVPTQAPVTAPPMQTQAPAAAPPTQALAPTAAPTAPPTATAAPTAVPASDGSFSSNTGTNLNMTVSWRTEDLGNGNTRVYVMGTVSSYSIDVMNTRVSISFGSYSATATGSAIQVEDDSARRESPLFSTSLDVPAGTSGTMTVEWAFNGSYSGVSLPTVQASGQVTA